MNSHQIDQIFNFLDTVNKSEKTFDDFSKWDEYTDRSSGKLRYVTAIQLNGILGGGVSIRITTPKETWEEDVYGQIEVRPPRMKRSLRVNPIEWRPLRPHVNSATAPSPYGLQQYFDRWHPYDLNKPLGIGAFDQSDKGVATPLPRAISSFSEYLELCSEIWKCPDVKGIPTPPWSPQLTF
ncbi:hypothetical protein [Pseudochrobactrum lubricantis]|uniref:hypothetical protein n=1 Tax=Pseudochrobactrum lubricantis TaxID=558172 RepID=UPI0035D5590F